MNLMQTLKKEINLVEKMIKKDVASEATVKILYKHIFKSDGKKIRARLNLISSSFNRNKNKIYRIKLAAIIELLHTATLVHDDVVDNSSIRRGNKSVNSVWSNAHGVLIGDYIYSKAFIYMVDIGNQKILQELSNATNDISQGELIQLDAINNKEITLNKLKKISYFKTGRLFEASAKTGAMLAGASKKYIENISECAKNIGSIVSNQRRPFRLFNKPKNRQPQFQDLKEGKITYPFFYAYKNANNKEKRILLDSLGSKKVQTFEILELIEKLDGINKTQKLAKQFHKNAIISAKAIDNIEVQREMIELTNTALNREK